MIKEKVGNRIKELRQETGLSQEKFSLKNNKAKQNDDSNWR